MRLSSYTGKQYWAYSGGNWAYNDSNDTDYCPRLVQQLKYSESVVINLNNEGQSQEVWPSGVTVGIPLFPTRVEPSNA